MHFLIATSFTFLVICSALPNCCFDASHFSDFFSCNLTCASRHETADTCSSCQEQISKIQNSSSVLDGFNIATPVISCQDLVYKNKEVFGRVLLTWLHKNAVVSSVFLVESRNSSSNDWSFVGMTNKTVAVVNYLNTKSEYQFRITPFIMPNLILPSLISDWIYISDIQSFMGSPFNVTMKNFRFQDHSIEVTLEWMTSKEIPCSYMLYWLPSNTGDFFGQKTINLLNGTLSTVLSGLLFETNYTIKLTALDSTYSRQVNFTGTSFVTPSCLSLTGGNFTLCAPGPPLNLTSLMISENKAQLSWLPPSHTSLDNKVSGYHISVIEVSEKHYILLKYKEAFIVNENVLNTTISDLRPAVLYIVQVRAFSTGGNGLLAEVDLHLKEISPGYSEQAINHIPWHYILPSLGLAFVVITVAVSIRFCHLKKKSYKHKGYPSGSADVPDIVRPFLLQSNKIDIQDVIGQGEFGVVHKGVYSRKKTKEIVAVKVFPAESISRGKLLNEVEILQSVGRHRNVVSLIGFTLDVDKMFLVLEYCALDNLHKRLRKLKKELCVIKRQLSDPKKHLSKSRKGKKEPYGITLCSYIHQIALGMEHISSLRMIHRDLAARNILLYNERHVKIADFGLSKNVYETETYTMSKQRKLPLRWMAPEAIEKHLFSTHSDVWSFGVLMWEIFKFGKVPYSALCNSTILPFLKSGFRLSKPHATSQVWYDLMLDCWQWNPEKRPTFQQLVKRTEDVLSRLCHYTVIDV